jgi:hypothetical protein
MRWLKDGKKNNQKEWQHDGNFQNAPKHAFPPTPEKKKGISKVSEKSYKKANGFQIYLATVKSRLQRGYTSRNELMKAAA